MNLNATLIAQLVVFLVLVWFTMRYVWPPISQALDERVRNIADGLAAAERGRMDLEQAEHRVADMMAQGQKQVADIVSRAEKHAAQIVDDAKRRAEVEASEILLRARAEADLEFAQAKRALQDQLAALVTRGVESILRAEIDASKNNHIIERLKQEL